MLTKNLAQDMVQVPSKSEAGMIESNNDDVIAIPVMSNQARSITRSIRAGTFWVENPDG